MCVCVCVSVRVSVSERRPACLPASRVFISVPSIHPFHFPANRECITRGQCVNLIVRLISCVRGARTEQVNVGLKPSGHYTYRQFNIHKFSVLPTQCICVFCVDLRTNSDYFAIRH